MIVAEHGRSALKGIYRSEVMYVRKIYIFVFVVLFMFVSVSVSNVHVLVHIHEHEHGHGLKHRHDTDFIVAYFWLISPRQPPLEKKFLK